MTDAPQLDDPAMLAAEFALGVLEGDELARARRLMLSDPKFAAEVDQWALRLGGMAASVEAVAPPTGLWAAIDQRIAGGIAESQGVNAAHFASGASRWNIAAAVATLLFAATAAMLYFQPGVEDREPVVPADPIAAPQLIAQLSGEEAGPEVAVRIEQADRAMRLKVAGIDPGALSATQAPVLWVVPGDGVPRSMGIIPVSGIFERPLTDAEGIIVAEGATLAVTYEPRAASRHDAPTTPIVASGTISAI